MKFEEEMKIAGAHAAGKLLVGTIGEVGVVLFNQPEKRNAVSLEMWEAIGDALDAFGKDESVRVVIYAGAGGKAFTSGNDISQFAQRRSSAQANEEFSRITARGRQKMADFPKPSIACIQGWCLGGGFGTALQADLRVAGPDAVFGIPAARLGIAYGMEPMERLLRAVGPGRARLLLYTARRFGAIEAHAMGIVEVLARVDAADEALALAREIAGNAPLSVQASKFVLEQAMKEPARRDLEAVAAWTRLCMDSADYREGRSAFMEKRKPSFTGR